MPETAVDLARLLTDDMLARFDERAPVYDHENRFFDEDWAELRDSGYLTAAVPAELGGAGLNLLEIIELQERLAYHAPATAIAVNMHLFWTGVAADLYRNGDESCRWLLEEAARDLTITGAGQRTSITLTRSMAYHPEVQRGVADMRMALDVATAVLHANARDWSAGVAHEDWAIRLLGTRHFVINQAYAIVDRALDLSGGSGVFKQNRLEQLFRDVRMGRFHPANDLATHELIGKMCLGVDPDDPQRWG